ncbi:MAG: hypothetical protein AB8B66_01210 [Rickettsiaceae bacterium]
MKELTKKNREYIKDIALRPNHLEVIDLSSTKISESLYHHVMEIIKQGKVKELSLNNTSLPHSYIQNILKELQGCKSLNSLDLVEQQIFSLDTHRDLDNLTIIESLANLKSLECIKISYLRRATDAFVTIMSELKSIKSIFIKNTDLKHETFNKLLNIPSLTKLDLDVAPLPRTKYVGNIATTASGGEMIITALKNNPSLSIRSLQLYSIAPELVNFALHSYLKALTNSLDNNKIPEVLQNIIYDYLLADQVNDGNDYAFHQDSCREMKATITGADLIEGFSL